MAYQAVFKRYELKYLLTRTQQTRLLEQMQPYMVLDRYGRTTIRNLYYDTDDYRLIRHSLEKPIYKEKLRLRSYGPVTDREPVFVELKKKYDHVVYKRRLSLPYGQALHWLAGEPAPADTQIAREIHYFLHYYPRLHPTVYLSYERQAYCPRDGGDFRVTFDDTLLARTTDLSLHSEPYGTPLLDRELVLMELKCSGGIPLWMTHLLNRGQLNKTSFSKYGTAYEKLLHTHAPYYHTLKENDHDHFQRTV